MKNILYLLLLLFSYNAISQTVAEVELSPQGLVLPRYTKADKLSLPATTGRMVFNTTDQGLVYRNDSDWQRVASETRVMELINSSFEPFVSTSGDRLYVAPGQFVIVPGISAAQATVTDIDFNVYQTVNINGMEWMAENLKTTRYANGDPIPYANTGGSLSGIHEDDDLYFHLSDDPVNQNISGLLYTHAAASDQRNVCPTGWRLPGKADWESLKLFLTNNGWQHQEGRVLKAQYAGWRVDNPIDTPADAYGMAIKPGQYYGDISANTVNSSLARFWGWERGLLSNTNAAYASLSWYTSALNIDEHSRKAAFSIRCRKQ